MDSDLKNLGFNLTNQKHIKVNLGLAGDSGSGKTFSVCSTFPDVYLADFDNGASALYGRDITVFPFYNKEWCKEQGAKSLQGNVDGLPISCVNRRDIFKKYVDTVFKDIPAGSTLVVDSWSKLQEFFDEATHCQPAMSNNGSIDTFSFWRRKITYSEQVMSALMSLQCNVVVMFHLIREQDEYGRPTGKHYPLMQGKFQGKVQSYFDNFFIQNCICRYDNKGEDLKTQKKNGKLVFPQPELIENDLNYLWRVRNSPVVDAKCALPGVVGPFVKADYKSIEQAFEKNEQSN